MTSISKRIIKWLGWNVELDKPLSSRKYIIVVTNQIGPWELLLVKLMLKSIGIGGLVMYYLRILGKPYHRKSTDEICFTDVINEYRCRNLAQQYNSFSDRSMYVNLVGKYNLVGTWHTCIHSIKYSLELDILSGFLDRKNKTLRLRNEIYNNKIERLGREDLGQLNYPSSTPTSWNELRNLIILAMLEFGEEADLNYIDTSMITDMSCLFASLREFNGRIDKWDVSNVVEMNCMFSDSNFNRDISQWNVGNVVNMSGMFAHSKFNGDIGKWDTSSVINMSNMFMNSPFNQDIGNWNVENVKSMSNMFCNSEFNQDIGMWKIDSLMKACDIFLYTEYKYRLHNWVKQRPDLRFGDCSYIFDEKWIEYYD